LTTLYRTTIINSIEKDYDGDSTHIQISKADLTGDGRITVADIVELARRIANQ